MNAHSNNIIKKNLQQIYSSFWVEKTVVKIWEASGGERITRRMFLIEKYYDISI